MASKIAKKKASVKVAPKVAAKPSAAKLKSASVISMNPMASAMAGMANSNLNNFKPSMPSLDGSLESMENTMNNFKNQYEKMTGGTSASVRENVDMISKSSATFAKGTEQILKTLAENAQESSQRNMESMKALMACKTLNEFAEAQNKLVQQNFDEAMSTMTKLSEMTIKLCTEAFEPINGQMTKAMTSAMKKNAA